MGGLGCIVGGCGVMRRHFSVRLVAVREAGAGHALAQAALVQEILFQSAELLVEQVVGLVDQADGDVGDRPPAGGFPRTRGKAS